MGRRPTSEALPAALDPSTLREAAAAIEREFPLAVRRTGLVLYDVDLTRLQAQWQVTADDLNRARSAFPPEKGGVRPVLRLWRLDAEGGAREVAVLPQPPAKGALEGEAVFTVGGEGERYQAELGLASADGGWLLLARSNLLEVIRPRERPVPRGRTIPPFAAPERAAQPMAEPHAHPAPELATPPALAVGIEPAGRPATEPEAPRRLEPYSQPAPVVGVESPEPALSTPLPSQPPEAVGARRPDPTLDPPGFALEPIFPNPLEPRGSRRQATTGEALRGDSAISASPMRSPQSADVPLTEREAPPEEPSRSDSGIQHSAFPMPQSGLPPPILPSTLHEWRGGGDLLVRYDPTHGLSSRALHGQPGAPEVELHAELLVWGRVPAGGLVEVMGRRLRVGADGRFFVREAVEDLTALGIAVHPSIPERDAE